MESPNGDILPTKAIIPMPLSRPLLVRTFLICLLSKSTFVCLSQAPTLPIQIDMVLDGYPEEASIQFNGSSIFDGLQDDNFLEKNVLQDLPFGAFSTLTFLDSYGDGFYVPTGAFSENDQVFANIYPGENRIPSWQQLVEGNIGSSHLVTANYYGDDDDVPSWGQISKSGSLSTGNVDDDCGTLCFTCYSDDATQCDDIFSFNLNGLYVEEPRVGFDLTFTDFDYSVTASGDATGGENYWGKIGFEPLPNCTDGGGFLSLSDGTHSNQQSTLNSAFYGDNLATNNYATGKVYRYIPPDGAWCANSGSASLSVSNMTLKYRPSKGERDFVHNIQNPVWNGLIIGHEAIIEHVELDIDCSVMDDVRVTLTKGSTEKILFSQLGGLGSGLDVTFTDFADNRINNNCNSSGTCFTGQLKIESGFLNQAFEGETVGGLWTLKVEDVASEDKTYLKEFDIKFRRVESGTSTHEMNLSFNEYLGDAVYLSDVDYSIVHPSPASLKIELIHNGIAHTLRDFGEAVSGQSNIGRVNAFDGEQTAGAWTFRITDNSNSGVRYLQSWGLTFTDEVVVASCEGEDRESFHFRAYPNFPDGVEPSCTNNDLNWAYSGTEESFSEKSITHFLPELASPRNRYVGVNHNGITRPLAIWESYDEANDLAYLSIPIKGQSEEMEALSVYISEPFPPNFDGDNYFLGVNLAHKTPTILDASEHDAIVTIPHKKDAYRVRVAGGTEWTEAYQESLTHEDIQLYLKEQDDVGTIELGLFFAETTNYENFGDADGSALLSMMDVPRPVNLSSITGNALPEQFTFWVGNGTTNETTTIPRWYLGPIDYSQILDLPSSTDGVQIGAAGGAIRAGAIANVHYAATLDVGFQEEEAFEDGVLHLAYPITDPNANVSDQTGQHAFDNGLSYWGFPNGQQGYAEMHVTLTDVETGAIFDTLLKSTQNPFVNKNCPYLIQDSLVMDIPMSDLPDGPNGFAAGDRVDVSSVAFWATQGRRTMIFTNNETDDRQVLCATPATIALATPSLGSPTLGVDPTADIALTWEAPIGGRSFVEFRTEGTEAWTQLTTGEGLLRTENSATHTIGVDTSRCDVIEYRVRTELCTHTLYTNVMSLLIDADLDNPWEAVGAGEGDIIAEKGYRDDKVWVDWSVVEDNSDAFGIDSYRVERRPYLPAEQGPEDDWIVVFSSIDQWSWFDETAGAGQLYEYRVAAIIDCGEDKYAEYYGPNAIGFRTAVAQVNGQVTYGSGAPVDSVRLDVEKMTGADARLALQLQNNAFLDLPAAALREDVAEGFAQTQWIRLDEFRDNSEGVDDLTPLVSWWVEDQDGDPAELMSLRARPIPGQPDTMELDLFRAGDPVAGWSWPAHIPGWNRGTYRHISTILDVHTGEGTDGYDTLRLVFDGIADRTIAIGLQSDVEGDLATLRAIRWGAGQDLVEGCIDPAATSFDPLASLTNADLCAYNEQTGCTDPAASNFSAPAEIDIQNCNFYGNQIATAFRINWFSDGSEDPANEYPVIMNHAGVVVWSAEEESIATGVLTPWEVRTYRLALQPGAYEMGVYREGSAVEDGVFEGNFDLYDEHGNEYVNCTQFFTADFLNDLGVPNPYLFEVGDIACSGAQSDAVTSASVTLEGTQPGAIPAVTDCANCYSWRFDGVSNSNGYFEDTWSRSTPVTAYTIETWIQPHAGAMTGKKLVFAQRQNFRRIELYLDEGQLAAGINDGSNEWYFHAENSLDPAAGADKLLPYQWYHVIFTLDTQANEASLVARPTSFNVADAQVWNDALEVTCNGVDCSGGNILDINLSTANIRLGGSHRAQDSTFHDYGNFEGLIHRLSVWDRVLSETEQLALFEGPTEEWYDGHGGGLIWVSTAISSDRAHNRLDGSAIPEALNIVETTSGARRVRSVRRAPFGTCISGCNVLFDAYGAQAAPGDFNPFANDYTDCDLAPTGVTIGSQALATGPISLDEVRLWKDVVGEDAMGEPKYIAADSVALATFSRYVDYNAPGLFNYLEFDEVVGNRSYDRARNEQGEWLKRDAVVMRFAEETGLVYSSPAEDHFINGEPQALRNEAYTDSLGQYVIESIKYTGTGNTFKIDPEKGPPAHTFGPTQFNANLGDANRNQSNLDFLDMSSFELDVEVVFQGRNPLEDYGTGTGVPDEDYRCPVKGAQFLINGSLQFNPDYTPLESDSDGKARLTVPIGTQTIQVSMTDHNFTNGGSVTLTMTNDRLGDDGILFTDITTSTAIGRVIGGLVQAEAEWDESINNLGIAQFYLIPIDTIGGSVIGSCPAVPITTDALTGQYQADLLPVHYRIAKAFDAVTDADGDYVHFQSVDESLENITTGITITGWDLSSPDETLPDGGWFDALSGDSLILDLSKGYAQSEDQLVEEAQESNTLPEGVTDRADLVYIAPPAISTFHVSPTATTNGLICENTLTELPSVMTPFIGADSMTFATGEEHYTYNLRSHFDDNLGSRFAFGVPVVETRNVYCIGIAVTEHYKTIIPATYIAASDSDHDQEEFTLSSKDGLELSIVDGISQASPTQVALEGTPVVWAMTPKMPGYSPGTPPLGTFDMHLAYQGEIIPWQPFDDYSNWSVSRMEQVEELDESFQAVILGAVTTLPGVPLSTNATLDYILRDPPGDGSSASIAQGSSFSTSKSLTGQGHGELETSFEISAVPSVELGIFAGGFAGLGGGVVFGVSEEISIKPELSVTVGAKVEGGGGSTNSWEESLTINQSVSTSTDEQPGNSGVNQDLFFGRTTNVYSTEIQRFGLASELAMDLKSSECGCSPYFEFAEGGASPNPMPSIDFVNESGDVMPFALSWNAQVLWEVAPASFFMKTQYDIETNILPALEQQRNQTFAEGLGSTYAWPNGNTTGSYTFPEGMYLANNDDPRWWLYHTDAATNAGFAPSFPLHPTTYTENEKTGPGYQFLGSNLNEDTVRYYNNLILGWKMMLARNELDKLNARKYLESQIALYDEIDELENPLLNLLADGEGYSSISAEESELPDDLEDLWGSFDFAPFFLAFSGGAGEFTQSFEKTTVDGSASNWYFDISANVGLQFGFKVKGVGVTNTTSLTGGGGQTGESNENESASIAFSYTLTDEDEDDFYLVGVMPGRGADGPIFLNLGAASTSCPWDGPEPAKYEEYYLFFADNLEARIASATGGTVDCSANQSLWDIVVDVDGTGLFDFADKTTHVKDYTSLAEAQAGCELFESYSSGIPPLGSIDYSCTVSAVRYAPLGGTPIHDEICTVISSPSGLATSDLTVQPTTLQAQDVGLYANTPNSHYAVVSGPMDEPLFVDLLVHNQTQVGALVDYQLRSIPSENEISASLSLAGGPPITNLFWIPPTENGEYTEVTASIRSAGLMESEFLEGDVMFEVFSLCDYQIRDTVRIHVIFEPACSDITLTSPSDNWNSNVLQTWSTEQIESTNDELTLRVDGLNRTLQNYLIDEAVAFEYRTSSDLEWQTFSLTPFAVIDSLQSGEGYIESVFDVGELFGDIEDDQVMIRARTQCSFGLTEVTDVAIGAIDRIKPGLFGDPLPLDRVYEPSDEFTIRFNEPMDASTFTTGDVTLSGHFNGENDWSGGLAFSGAESIVSLDGPSLMNHSWTATGRLWVDFPGAERSGAVFGQGVDEATSLRFGFDAGGNLVLERTTEGITTTVDFEFSSGAGVLNQDDLWTAQRWNRFQLTLAYDRTVDGLNFYDVELGVEGTTAYGEIGIPDAPSMDFVIGNTNAGNQALSLPLSDLRIWQGDYNAEQADNPDVTNLTGEEVGLALWLPTTELTGAAKDHARGRTLDFDASWVLPEGGGALKPALASEVPVIAGVPASSVQSTTLEFWFKPSGSNGETILSSHNIRPPGATGEVVDEQAWSIRINALGQLEVLHRNMVLTSEATLGDNWHHLALVRETGSTIRLYLDGGEIAAQTVAESSYLFPIPLHLGAQIDQDGTGASFYDEAFTGLIDELRFWMVALEPDVIEARRHARLSYDPTLLFYAPFDSLGVTPYDGLELELAVPDAELYVGMSGALSGDENGFGAAGISDAIVINDGALIPLTPSESISLPEEVLDVDHNAQADQFIVHFNPDRLWRFEDQRVSVNLSNDVRDALGNPLAESHSWGYIFDRHPLHLSTKDWSTAVLMGESTSTTFTITNTGIDAEPWTLASLPSWLEASPASGTLEPLSAVEVTLTADNDLTLGEFIADFRVEGDFCDYGSPASELDDWCYGERFSVSLLVEAEAPEFNFDPAGFDGAMSVVAKIYNNGYASYDERDIVLAYIGGELRGLAPLDVPIGPQRLAYLTVFFDAVTETGEDVEFRVWDASRGMLFAALDSRWPDLQTDYAVTANEEGIGGAFDPLLLVTTNHIEQSFDLQPGWNWASFNVIGEDLGDLSAALGEDVVADLLTIKDHASAAQPVAGGWFGPLDTLRLDNMYQIQMAPSPNAPWTVARTGEIPDRFNHAQALYGGWNQIGYLPFRELPVETALQSLWDADTVLTINDLVKSRYDGFATYLGNGEWAGSLQWMRPGQGYKLRLGGVAAGEPAGDLIFPAAGMMTTLENRATAAEAAVWPQAVADLPAQQNLIIAVDLPSWVPQDPADVIGVFRANGDCVGQIHRTSLHASHRWFLTAYGDLTSTGEPLTFQWHSDFAGRSWPADETITFAPEALTGKAEEPFVLHFAGAGLAPATALEAANGTAAAASATPSDAALLRAYPSPVVDNLTIEWNGAEPVRAIRLLDTHGRVLRVLDLGASGAEGPTWVWSLADCAAGTYLIELITETEQHRTFIIK